MKDFSGKVALITGAARGFGKEFAKEAFHRGMRLFLADIAFLDENGDFDGPFRIYKVGTKYFDCN